MLFRLVSPVKRSGSSIPQLTKRIPGDVRERMIGLTLAIPIGPDLAKVRITERTDAIRTSLRTTDPSEAKKRQAEALIYLETVFAAARAKAPVALTPRQATALAGEMYRSWANTEGPVATLSVTLSDSGREVEQGYLAGEEAELIFEATIAMLDRARQKGEAEDFEPMFGAIIDRELLARGISSVDVPSRRLLLDAFWLALRDGMEAQQRASGGDYRLDPKAERFPLWKGPEQAAAAIPQPTSGSVTLDELLKGWWTESEAAGLKRRTYLGYRSTFTKLKAHLGHDEAGRVAPEDIVSFKESRLKEASARTVKDTDLAALKSVFGWGVQNRKVRINPAEGISIKLGKQRRLRTSGFSADEAAAILRASRDLVQGTERPETYGAKRWIPWLLAYSGARVGEMAQLRKEDVVRREDHWAVILTPEAGTVKGNEAREVPLHPHLIEEGFIEFVQSRPKGHLFLRPNSETGDVLGPLTGVKNRVREFVRSVVPDPNVQPNHAWRHLFMTRSRAEGVDQELRRMITGHTGDGVDEQVYGDPAGLYREICKLPRFKLD